MATEKNPKLFDLRVVERNIAKGLITRDEYEAYLQSIDDSAERAEKIESEFVENVLNQDGADQAD